MVGPDFAGTSVVASFRLVEQMLEEVLRFVPFCPEHEHVWSPVLVTILLDTCSQLDSLWKFEVGQLTTSAPPPTSRQFDIRDYFQQLGKTFADRWVVLWGEKGERIQPFEPWAGVPDYSKKSYKKLTWWDAYNRVKHDRLANRKAATMKNIAYALSGLFLGIVRSQNCAESIAQEGWIPSPNQGAPDPRDLVSDDPPVTFLVAESKLLSHLLTKDSANRKGTKLCTPRWASYRFLRWFQENVADSNTYF